MEPQIFNTYHKRAKTLEMKKHLQDIKLYPDEFSDYLIQEIGFSSFKVLGTGDNDANGFRRSIFLFKK